MSTAELKPQLADDPRGAAIKLASHSFWAGVAFVVVILVAVGLEWVSKALIYLGLITKGSVLDWAIHFGAYALGGIDLALLIGIVGKLAFRLLRAV